MSVAAGSCHEGGRELIMNDAERRAWLGERMGNWTEQGAWVDCPECRDPAGQPQGEHVVNTTGDPQDDHAVPCWRCSGNTVVRRGEGPRHPPPEPDPRSFGRLRGSHEGVCMCEVLPADFTVGLGHAHACPQYGRG